MSLGWVVVETATLEFVVAVYILYILCYNSQCE